MNVAELKRALVGVADDMPVVMADGNDVTIAVQDDDVFVISDAELDEDEE